jgi:ATP-dependent DNA helicase RecG
MSNINDILSRLNWVESCDLELKSAKGGLPRSLWETYSAMANTQGGVILLGVEDNGTVSGTDNLTKLKKNFWDTINNRGKVNINLLDEGDLQDIPTSDKAVLALRIPRATRYQRPVFIGQNPFTGTYRRNHEGDYHCTPEEVSRMLSDRSEEPADRRILEHFTLDDLDRPSLQQYRQRFASLKPTHPWLSENDRGLLQKLGGWRRDRASEQEGLTLAGLLMFGKAETIQEVIPQYQIDYREQLTLDPQIRWTDRLTIDGTWPGNLFQFYLLVIQRLARDLKLPFQLDSELFRKGETIIHEAIREALVNAIIHADYRGIGGVVIIKYPDRFNFTNPGSLLISIEQVLQGNVSECRNKTLQTMFMMIGAGEKAGSGVDKILQGWQSQHWRLPIIGEQTQPDRVAWILPMFSLIPEESLIRLKQMFGNQFNQFSSLEVQALVTADLEKSVDNARMCQITREHPTDITKMLQHLVATGALIQKGQGRWTSYSLPLSPDSLHKTSDSLHSEFDSLHKTSDSLHSEFDSLHKTSDSLHNLENHNSMRDPALLEIAAQARNKKRLPPQEMEQLILQLCTDRWLTRSQLGKLVHRHAEGLRSRFLGPMVEHGLLRLRYPDKPNRTDQAYTKNLDAIAEDI